MKWPERIIMGALYHTLEMCRVCGSRDFLAYLDLGKTPLANSFLEPGKEDEEKTFPLKVIYCRKCSLSQLSIVVDPNTLFSHYVYRSSISKTFEQHCLRMAHDVASLIPPTADSLAVDIASNDGCLLKQFKKTGYRVLGIEPAANIAALANNGGIETILSFWGKDVAQEIIRTKGKAAVITATNVFAHVDDLQSFLQAVVTALDDNGLFIVEVPYLYHLLSRNEFDTVYHEHLSYFLVKPLHILYQRNNLTIVRIEQHPIHGGSLRIFAMKAASKAFAVHDSVNRMLEFEEKNGLYVEKTYLDFAGRVKEMKQEMKNLLQELKSQGKTIAGYGAPAKGNTLLNYFGIGHDLVSFIADDTPEKQGKLTPGTRIPISGAHKLQEEKPDYILLLAWNVAQELMKKTPFHRERGGKYIIPIPRTQIV